MVQTRPAVAQTRVLRARRSVFGRVRDIWTYRELLVRLVRKELKVKYKNSSLGFLWSLVNPLLYLLVYTLAFQVILQAGIPQFPIFLLSALLVWNLFGTGLGAGVTSIVVNAGLVKKVWFPREILVLAAIGAALVHFFLQAGVLLVFMAAVQHRVAFAYFPLMFLALVVVLVFTAAVAILLSAINVYLRDTQHFLELALLAWFWITPIVYPFMLMGKRAKWQVALYMCNPLTAVVLAFQRALYARLDGPTTGKITRYGTSAILPHWGMAGYGGYVLAVGVFSVALLFVALYVFGRLESNFAEEL
ncbi:MAG: type transporter [Actinomycetia bacterium]|jgi:ABC-2 type transport system permease protein|nr:type transporter [Actinomycetes bacterium]